MSQKDKMHSGELYVSTDESIIQEQLQCLNKLYDFNATRPTELDKRQEMLKDMFAEIGEGCYIEPPLHANWGGKHCHLGTEQEAYQKAIAEAAAEPQEDLAAQLMAEAEK